MNNSLLKALIISSLTLTFSHSLWAMEKEEQDTTGNKRNIHETSFDSSEEMEIERDFKKHEILLSDNATSVLRDVLVLVFQYPGTVIPAGAVCKKWESIRYDYRVPLIGMIKTEEQFQQMCDSQYMKSRIHISSCLPLAQYADQLRPLLSRNIFEAGKIHTLDLSFHLNVNPALFAAFANVHSLSLRYTSVNDVSPFSDVVVLDLNHCDKLTDISPLGKGKLVKLNLCSTRVTDVSALQNLQYLCIVDTNITNVTNLKSIVELTVNDEKPFRPSEEQRIIGLSALIQRGVAIKRNSDFSIRESMRGIHLNMLP
jgi:hypothetical protein